MTTPLTALENDLLACVERLVTACETSAKELRALETRSTTGIESKLIGLANCVELLMKSHLLSVATLADLLREEATYVKLEERLQASLRLAKVAEQKLKQS